MPALADLGGLCPVVLLDAEYDGLRASSQAFAATLALAGVDVRRATVRGVLHGFLGQPATLAAVDGALSLLAGTVRDL